MVDQVFIIDMVRADGRPFVTSVGTASEIANVRRRLKPQSGRVSHWQRDGESFRVFDYGMAFDWRLTDRFAL